ncbi:CRIB domain-containing protein RIC6-like [Juglans microcarpa x Juglans regia]|uniref:CRIB domain-containing protein RIC6-like n=1 Tax=Juglans microcarpa x Juglans regia TaxID=2249226 RepID=UPI001B7DD9AF|nr:CRIB domain-containing protein RIC6-like [Juglans microcarpa x Juglans regia]
MSNNKVKGLLKGLRYISQIFADNEKEPEIQIGLPTDVKHVAHIGWDGPSVNSPTRMNEFKSPSGFSSESLILPEDHTRDNNGRRSAGAPNSPAKESSEPPRSSRRQSSSSSTIESVTDSPNRGKLEKPKQSRKSSKSSIKDSPDGTKVTRVTCRLPSDSNQAGSVSPAHDHGHLPVPDIPKKAGRKKSKEHSLSNGSKKSSRSLKSQDSPEIYHESSFSHAETYQSPFSDPGPGSESIST